ncbi:c-type cytochrome [Pseudoduganella sp. DS3]|uniref:C-type cytochrome n=1 Tax=Pseudoduganella guangdongensis TaxID=2692179 RepID=A0A6N9HLM0_9BURK|nr:c-type cytochrome [Pseudoduganella guangdongensis]MYN03852.1 c-type cytochrome [Pseudoduganella guangdongensis]
MTPALQSILSPAGPDAVVLARLAWLLFGAGALIFLLVAVLAVAAVRGRRGKSWSRWLVVGGGLVVPIPLLAALMAWSGWQASHLAWPFSGAARIHVSVTAHMWWWEVRYRDTRSGRQAVLANEIRLPAGERVYLALASADVLHAFWVPALGGKVDMVPGRLHGLTLQADTPGHYRAPCAEYCGTQHTGMALDVLVQPPAAFDAWLAQQASPATPAPQAVVSATVARGRQVFLAARCNACHAVRGVAEGATLGPDLTHLASRRSLAAGTLPMTRAALLGWIANPQAAKPGARMPPSSLPPEDLQALAAWLESLR